MNKLSSFNFIVLPKSRLKVYIAKSDEEKRQGLIGVDKRDFGNSVMLFIDISFGDCFHMRGVKFPITIAFLDKDFNVIKENILKDETSTSKAPSNAIFALEFCVDNIDIYNCLDELKEVWK